MTFEQTDLTELMEQRYELALSRIAEIQREHIDGFSDSLTSYFQQTAAFCTELDRTYHMALGGEIATGSLESLRELNIKLYEDILPEHYGQSFANPVYAAEQLGEPYGQYLSLLLYELRSCIPHAFEAELVELAIRFELLLEVYGSFVCAMEEKSTLPSEKALHDSFYYFFNDYAEDERHLHFRQMVDPVQDYARDLIKNSDLEDLTYLYRFGEYISENELATARHLNELPEETIAKMADTFTEGYRIGFETNGKDLSIKKTVSLRYVLGYERMMRRAIDNFEKMGLQVSVYRALPSLFHQAHSTYRNGYHGAEPNKQYLYDHKDDDALFLDKALISRRLEATESAGEAYKAQARAFGGPAVLEVFGEKPFAPAITKEAVHLNTQQEHMISAYSSESAVLLNKYIPGEERSFTIISFPAPEIGEQYAEIFDETVRLNTLDYALYQRIQQTIIDTLDKADTCRVLGMNGNHTDMTVKLHRLTDPATQSNFENCVADVNIPVGEVFTSPVLKGTNGVLHVTGVYLEGLFFKDLSLTFKDGCIADYSCANFADPAENRKYIEDNILFHHETLPIGEFAIGTNTVAYQMARKYDIADVLTILIAEKTGPHFAVGDTCYSHEEENVTYNPDGKRLIAKSNEISDLRDTDSSKAYFSCHTDITIPYDELGRLFAVAADGSEYTIIENGRFVLPGTEQLNEALDKE